MRTSVPEGAWTAANALSKENILLFPQRKMCLWRMPPLEIDVMASSRKATPQHDPGVPQYGLVSWRQSRHQPLGQSRPVSRALPGRGVSPPRNRKPVGSPRWRLRLQEDTSQQGLCGPWEVSTPEEKKPSLINKWELVLLTAYLGCSRC